MLEHQYTDFGLFFTSKKQQIYINYLTAKNKDSDPLIYEDNLYYLNNNNDVWKLSLNDFCS